MKYYNFIDEQILFIDEMMKYKASSNIWRNLVYSNRKLAQMYEHWNLNLGMFLLLFSNGEAIFSSFWSSCATLCGKATFRTGYRYRKNAPEEGK